MRTADEPGQTINVDLCFVPAAHTLPDKLPAVSGSSGRLVVERVSQQEQDPTWPGQVFEDETRDYSQAMLDFKAMSQLQQQDRGTKNATQSETVSLKAQKRALRQEEEDLRITRRIQRQRRKPEDAVWKELKQTRRQQKITHQNSSAVQRQADDQQWRVVRDQRRSTVKHRQAEDNKWRIQRHTLRQRKQHLPIVTAWIAILVITDNCTRKSLGLPLFTVGSRVTAAMVVEALRVLLPVDLQFLISDRGTHFTADCFAKLAEHEEFVHIVIARHRPQSNGIAERFVRTLKQWLRHKVWQDDQQLTHLLGKFLLEYNNRPHQGLPIPGLSPNEFENRIWVM